MKYYSTDKDITRLEAALHMFSFIFGALNAFSPKALHIRINCALKFIVIGRLCHSESLTSPNPE